MVTRPPSDAVVALRSLGRRFRAVFAGHEHDESPDELAHRVGPDGLSALDHVVAATRTITFLGRALQQVLVEDDPLLHPGVVDPAARDFGPSPDGPLEDRLAELGWEADALADRVEHEPAEAWGWHARIAGADATANARSILWDAVDTAVEHLRSAEHTLDAVRRRR